MTNKEPQQDSTTSVYEDEEPTLKPAYERFKLIIWSALQGGITGMLIGGKWSGAGGWGFGALTQIIGMIIPGSAGALFGLFGGMFYTKDYLDDIYANFRQYFGSGPLTQYKGTLE